MLKNQGKLERNEFGAARESNKGRGRFDLFPYEAMEALAIWYELGGEKYGDRNWEKGLDIDDTLNRMTRHAIKACNGWKDEDHLAAVMWNAAAVITLRARATKSAEDIMQANTCISEEDAGRIIDSVNKLSAKDLSRLFDNHIISPEEFERLRRAQDKEHD